MTNHVKHWEEDGVKVFVCAASGAAHLAGSVAAKTTLPVLGVPLAVPPLNGMDSLLATVQMPPGIPVATLSAGQWGAVNAGILAAQILAVADPALAERLRTTRKAMQRGVAEKDRKVRVELGLESHDT